MALPLTVLARLPLALVVGVVVGVGHVLACCGQGLRDVVTGAGGVAHAVHVRA